APTAPTAPTAFGGAAASAAGLPTDVTGSFHVGTIEVNAAGADGTASPADPPYDGATGVPGGLDPATGVYVLPHQHGQESGS
ncbi:hypothetical protein, partial [Streptacidiphilus neutrinimicus]|uniref:hypothetical protein n=1 Tax=Streptacidiphilus neutrinimicus TaxID=105420 RepID=UPI0005A8E1DB